MDICAYTSHGSVANYLT